MAGGNPYKSHIFQYLRSFTEEWNGSAWSENTNLPHQLTFLNHQSAGTQNAGLIAGGYTVNSESTKAVVLKHFNKPMLLGMV